MSRRSAARVACALIALTACTQGADATLDSARLTATETSADSSRVHAVPLETAAVRDSTSAAAAATVQLPPTSGAAAGTVVTERGVGPVRLGMTIAQASSALHGGLTAPRSTDTSSCGYATLRGALAGVRLMTAGGRVVRVDVDRGTTRTDAGARIGDAEGRVERLYAGRVKSGPSKYESGHSLVVTPAAPADSGYRIVFETDGRVVTKYRAGRRPEVEYVEGCG
ncbi:MAG: hypothetical protein ABJA80_08395 [bacterium]